MCENDCIIINRIICVRLQYLKPFNGVQIEVLVIKNNNRNNLTVYLEMNLGLGINFLFIVDFCPHLGSFCIVSSSLRFGQISPLAFFRWVAANLYRNADSCNRILSNYCLP